MTKAERVVDQLLRNGLRICGGTGPFVPLTYEQAIAQAQAAIVIADTEAKALSDSQPENAGPVDAFAAKLIALCEECSDDGDAGVVRWDTLALAVKQAAR